MHLKPSYRPFLELHDDPKSASRRLSGSQENTKIQQKSIKKPSESPKWRQVGPKFSQDPQMTTQWAPKRIPKDLPGRSQTPSKQREKVLEKQKKKLAGISPCSRQDFCVFLQAVEKTVQFVKKPPWTVPNPVETLQKRASDMKKKKNGGHSPLMQTGFWCFSPGSGKNCSVC